MNSWRTDFAREYRMPLWFVEWLDEAGFLEFYKYIHLLGHWGFHDNR